MYCATNTFHKGVSVRQRAGTMFAAPRAGSPIPYVRVALCWVEELFVPILPPRSLRRFDGSQNRGNHAGFSAVCQTRSSSITRPMRILTISFWGWKQSP